MFSKSFSENFTSDVLNYSCWHIYIGIVLFFNMCFIYTVADGLIDLVLNPFYRHCIILEVLTS